MKLLVKGRRPLHATIKYRGLDIAIENQQSSARAWKNPDDGTQGMSHMKVPYGYFRGSLGVDGDAVDVYIGPDRNADTVYVIHQTKAPDFTEYDEDKVMLCFPSAQAAKDAYLKQYNDPRFFGSMTEMPFDEFKEKLAATKDNPGMIKAEPEFNVKPVVKDLWYKLVYQAMDDFNIHFDLENFDPVQGIQTYKTTDRRGNEVVFRYQLWSGGGDWQMPTRCFKCQLHNGHIENLSTYGKTAGFFAFIPSDKEGNINLIEGKKGLIPSDDTNSKQKPNDAQCVIALKQYFDKLAQGEAKAASLRKSGEAMCKQVGDSLGVDWNEVDLDEFCNGMFVEEEHKDVTHGDPKLTAKIVLAHLKERKDYYTQLEKIEKSVKPGLFLIRRL